MIWRSASAFFSVLVWRPLGFFRDSSPASLSVLAPGNPEENSRSIHAVRATHPDPAESIVVFTRTRPLYSTKICILYLLKLRNFLGPEIWASRSATYQEITGTINLPVDTSCCCNDYATQQFHINTNPPRQSGALIDLRLHVKDVVEAHMQGTRLLPTAAPIFRFWQLNNKLAAITYCQTCTQTGAPIDSGRLQALLAGQQWFHARNQTFLSLVVLLKNKTHVELELRT
jgi:hypothetical protein